MGWLKNEFILVQYDTLGASWWLSGKESTCQGKRLGVRSLGQEDPLEEVMATHISMLAWEIPWTESLAGCSQQGCKTVGHNLATKQQYTCASKWNFPEIGNMGPEHKEIWK